MCVLFLAVYIRRQNSTGQTHSIVVRKINSKINIEHKDILFRSHCSICLGLGKVTSVIRLVVLSRKFMILSGPFQSKIYIFFKKCAYSFSTTMSKIYTFLGNVSIWRGQYIICQINVTSSTYTMSLSPSKHFLKSVLRI